MTLRQTVLTCVAIGVLNTVYMGVSMYLTGKYKLPGAVVFSALVGLGTQFFLERKNEHDAQH